MDFLTFGWGFFNANRIYFVIDLLWSTMDKVCLSIFGEYGIGLLADKVFLVRWIGAVPTSIIGDDILIASCTAARLIIAPVSVAESWTVDCVAPSKMGG